jgi:hypothetical protein
MEGAAPTGGNYGNVHGNSSKPKRRRTLRDQRLTRVQVMSFVGDEDGRKVGSHGEVGDGSLELRATARCGISGVLVKGKRRGLVWEVAMEAAVS